MSIATLAQTPYLDVSQWMGRIVGIIVVLIVVLVIAKAAGIGGKKKK